MKCVICNKNCINLDHNPFCSKRCSDVDLLKWLNQDYCVEVQEYDYDMIEQIENLDLEK